MDVFILQLMPFKHESALAEQLSTPSGLLHHEQNIFFFFYCWHCYRGNWWKSAWFLWYKRTCENLFVLYWSLLGQIFHKCVEWYLEILDKSLNSFLSVWRYRHFPLGIRSSTRWCLTLAICCWPWIRGNRFHDTTNNNNMFTGQVWWCWHHCDVCLCVFVGVWSVCEEQAERWVQREEK